MLSFDNSALEVPLDRPMPIHDALQSRRLASAYGPHVLDYATRRLSLDLKAKRTSGSSIFNSKAEDDVSDSAVTVGMMASRTRGPQSESGPCRGHCWTCNQYAFVSPRLSVHPKPWR